MEQQSTWKHGFQQRTGIGTDPQRVKQILLESYEPQQHKTEIATRLIEGVKGRDSKMVLTKKELIDLILKNNEAGEKQIKEILAKYKGELNAYVSHVRQELK